MPDWFYRTVSRPLLFQLPARTARDFALGFMSTLTRLPLGAAMIDFLGHMRAPQELQRQTMGHGFPTAIGLGPYLDTEASALLALARFGFGFVEIGPVRIQKDQSGSLIERRSAQQAIRFSASALGLSLAEAEARLRAFKTRHQPLLIRLAARTETTAAQATAECCTLLDRLAAQTTLFSLATLEQAQTQNWTPEEWQTHLQTVAGHCAQSNQSVRLLLCVPNEFPAHDTTEIERWIAPALAAGCCGIQLTGSVNEGADVLVGSPAFAPARELTRQLRAQFGPEITIIAAGGIHEPAEAIALLNAGADLLQVDTGLVFSGPGLPKRINEALFYPTAQGQPADQTRAVEMTWFWTLLLGIGMLIGSVLALAIAATRVVLPYDESFVGLRRAALHAINDRLLLFMAHDRVSLAGTMITIGILYLGLTLGGVRRGLHWAQQAILYSALSGFLSFFLFLGFGYFDPFHAFVTAILFQFFLLAVHSRLAKPNNLPAPNLREDWRWRRNQWGQFMFVLHGFGLVGAGLAISAVGVTQVFVPEDLQFMQTSAAHLHAANHQLVPLIAHDRATFGGMLVASGIAVLLPALWGFKQGERWLWWTLALAAPPAYVAAIGVHFAVGYINLWHLSPVFAAFVLYAVGLTCSYPYLCAQPRETTSASAERLSTATVKQA